MNKISLKGVLIGNIVDLVASTVLGLPFAIYTMSKLDLAHTPKDQIGPTITAAIHGNIPLYVGQISVGLACSVLGGYVSARIAKHDELLNGALSAFLCVTLSVYVVVSGRDSNPHWLQMLLLLASPLLALLGGEWVRRRRQHQIGIS